MRPGVARSAAAAAASAAALRVVPRVALGNGGARRARHAARGKQHGHADPVQVSCEEKAGEAVLP